MSNVQSLFPNLKSQVVEPFRIVRKTIEFCLTIVGLNDMMVSGERVVAQWIKVTLGITG